MVRGRLVSKHRVCGASMMLALLLAAAPAPASAGSQAAVAESAVCTLTVSLVFAVPVSALPAGATGTPEFTVNGVGTCIGVTTTTVSIGGRGWTAVPPTCAQIVSAAGTATATVGSVTYPVAFTVTGPTAAPQLVMSSLPQVYPLGINAAAQLLIAPASLQACLGGGTTTLQYTGVVLIAG
jgi:hypothetical protein